MSVSICSFKLILNTAGSRRMAASIASDICSLRLGCRWSWYASVATNPSLDVFPKYAAKKKDAASCPFSLSLSQTVPMIADFPAPAGPVSHRVLSELRWDIQLYMSFWTASLVSSWHLGASTRSAGLCIHPTATCAYRSAIQHHLNAPMKVAVPLLTFHCIRCTSLMVVIHSSDNLSCMASERTHQPP